ncbi:hypothetical protein EJB05_02314 [Eragrostis curvula]|uniref:CRIB domain-containing protein n=1 Tax=Eragrostis curvula TaxID=38414 RepID=A0A5J9WSL3_9POAL|nr:hypothetical protein EJB05_02314 [Eragrostis curvula]
MTEVELLRGPTDLASPASRASSLRYLANADSDVLPRSGSPERAAGSAGSRGLQERRGQEPERSEEEEERLSFLALLFELLRKSLLRCKAEGGSVGEEGEGGGCGMEIGWPTDVQHVAHVTFDRFHGFLGLPSSSSRRCHGVLPVPGSKDDPLASVFGVSTESMQCSFDSRGNSVPTILLMMQRRLYEQGGLRAEGIFRINAENTQEEIVRDQLNSGIVPNGIDVHCLAGLIKRLERHGHSDNNLEDLNHPKSFRHFGSFRSFLSKGKPRQKSPITEEQMNKMNSRNIAMVFAPNMTQMADPLTALMYAVQVMNFLKMLIQKTLKDREESNLEEASLPQKDPSDENGHQKPSVTLDSPPEEGSRRPSFVNEEPLLNSPAHSTEDKPNEISAAEGVTAAFIGQTSEVLMSMEDSPSSQPALAAQTATDDASGATSVNSLQGKGSRSLSRRRNRKGKSQSGTHAIPPAEKSRGVSIVSRINSKVERIEAWR